MSRTSEKSRTVKRLNKRWDRQRPITRGGSDHEEPDEPPTITTVSPTFVVAGASDTVITLTGTGFVGATGVQWTGSTGGGSDATPTINSDTEIEITVPASFLDTEETSMQFRVLHPAGNSAYSTPPNFLEVLAP